MSEMQTLIEDLRYAIRMLRKNRAFTAVALLTLALGIGANTAVFSIVNGVLLSSLPFPASDKLVVLFESKPNFTEGSISYPNFLDWKRDNRSFTSIAAYRPDSFSLTGTGESEQINGKMLSADFFSVLGVKPLMGRMFAEEEDQFGAGHVVLVSDKFWKRKLGSLPDVLGHRLVLDGEGYTIIGVIPSSFHLTLPNFRDDGELYVPIGQWRYANFRDRSHALGMKAIGRLRPGVTLAQARADMDRVTRNLAMAFPQADAGEGATVVSLKRKMVGNIEPFLLLLLAAVCFVLLIACVNVANLLLARSTGRRREFAIRAALGARQGRVVRQLLTESILLALGGAALGLLLASWETRTALSLLPVGLPRTEGIRLDGHVLIFTVAVSVLAGVLFGLVPALRMAQPNVQDTLKEGGRAMSSHQSVQGAFVVVEMAMALVLLTGAGLMIRSLVHLWSTDPGFEPRNVLTFSVSLPNSQGTVSAEALRSTLRQLHDKLASLTGVQSVSLSGGSIPMMSDDEELFWVDGQPRPATDKDMNWTLRYTIEPSYFQTMSIPLKRGRLLTPDDNEHSRLVATVDEAFAQRYFPGQDPVGKHINMKGVDRPLEIVGVVRHVKQWGIDSDDKQSLHAQLYAPLMQRTDQEIQQSATGIDVVLRTDAAHPATLEAIRNAISRMNQGQFIYDVRPLDEVISKSLAAQRFSMILLGVFAALALLLASVGIYGVVSYLVGQRTHEIGIRMALGAQRWHILGLVLERGARLATVGVGLGLAAALGITRLMASLLYGVGATDPLTFAGVTILLVLVALAACYIPARRATKVDPLVALRYE